MPRFLYRAMAADGRVEHGTLNAQDKLDATRQLRRDGLMPVKLDHEGSRLRALLATDVTGGPSREQRLYLLETMHFLTQAGLNLDQVLASARDQMAGKAMAQCLAQAREKLQAGASLSQALGSSGIGLAASDLALIQAGESAGALSAVLGALVRLHGRRLAFHRMTVGALIYPAILSVTALGVIMLLVGVVVPQFEPVFAAAGADLPPVTRAVRDISHMVTAASPYALLTLCASAIWLAARRNSDTGRQGMDAWLLRLPWLGARLADAGAARLLRGLETMVEGGVPLHQAMHLLEKGTGNSALDARAADAAARVRAGTPLWRALADTAATPPAAAQLIRIGEDTGRLGPMLGAAANRLEQNFERQLTAFTALLTPAVMLAMGAIVGLIVWAVMAAVLDINRLV